MSAIGAIERAFARKTGNLLTLSEQQLIDCDKNEINTGCEEREYEKAFNYKETITTACQYPWNGKTNKCNLYLQRGEKMCRKQVQMQLGELHPLTNFDEQLNGSTVIYQQRNIFLETAIKIKRRVDLCSEDNFSLIVKMNKKLVTDYFKKICRCCSQGIPYEANWCHLCGANKEGFQKETREPMSAHKSDDEDLLLSV